MYLSSEKRATLNYANNIRARYGLPPLLKLLPGIPVSPSFCPLARTISAGAPTNAFSVTVDPQHVTVNGKNFYNPINVQEFVKNFDSGKKHLNLLANV